jgi:hypothetical protein
MTKACLSNLETVIVQKTGGYRAGKAFRQILSETYDIMSLFTLLKDTP